MTETDPDNPRRRFLVWDPSAALRETMLEFRLTYAGPISTSATAPEKQRLRRHFHKQLMHVWTTDEKLTVWREQRTHLIDEKYGFRWLPMVTKNPPFTCKLDVLLLRPRDRGRGVIQSSDIDNRLKTIFDALRHPDRQEECKGDGNAAVPEADEDPFFVLLSDDRLITHVAVESDEMLEPVKGHQNDVRLVIQVRIQTTSF